jgi:hypothetical protein
MKGLVGACLSTAIAVARPRGDSSVEIGRTDAFLDISE